MLLHAAAGLSCLQPGEVARGAVEGAVNFPLSSLREKLHELPQDKKLYVYCQVRGGRYKCTAKQGCMHRDLTLRCCCSFNVLANKRPCCTCTSRLLCQLLYVSVCCTTTTQRYLASISSCLHCAKTATLLRVASCADAA